MKRCVIIGGASIGNYPAVLGLLEKENDFYVVCDCGYRHCDPLGITPDLLVGDFDSMDNPLLPVETIVLPHMKDDTDTMYAVKEALTRGFESFLLLGAIGDRLDHSLGNLYILQYLFNRGKKAVIADDFSEMEIVGSEKAYISDRYPYFSLVNITGKAEGIYIENALYTLSGGAIEPEYQFGVSNEPLPGKLASVRVGSGSVLLIKDR